MIGGRSAAANWLACAGAFIIGLAVTLANSQTSHENEQAVALRDIRRVYALPMEQWPAPWIDADVRFAEFGPPAFDARDPNELQWAALGDKLFGDLILSAEGDFSCASCHQREHGWTVPRSVALGPKGLRGRRNPPSLLTAARQEHLGWIGQSATLRAQSLRPLILEDELGNANVQEVLQRLQAKPEYAAGFSQLNGGATISADDLARALTSFQKGLDAPTRFDRFLDGEREALSDREVLGLHLFRTKARCANCHMGPHLSDGRFHNLKISFFGEKSQDLGRYEMSGDVEDVGRFRTPSLRHVSKTAPYMHNGLFETLEGVINLYDRGGGEVWARNSAEAAHPLYSSAARLSPHIRPLDLTPDEKAALLAFLRAL